MKIFLFYYFFKQKFKVKKGLESWKKWNDLTGVVDPISDGCGVFRFTTSSTSLINFNSSRGRQRANRKKSWSNNINFNQRQIVGFLSNNWAGLISSALNAIHQVVFVRNRWTRWCWLKCTKTDGTKKIWKKWIKNIVYFWHSELQLQFECKPTMTSVWRIELEAARGSVLRRISENKPNEPQLGELISFQTLVQTIPQSPLCNLVCSFQLARLTVEEKIT